jgi:flagella basal body P-ring formation protein FlgA
MGDAIRISNVQSNTVIEGVVVGPGKVSVTPGSRMAMNEE